MSNGFDPLTAATILYLSAKGAGARRDLNLVTQTCALLGADLAVVQMCFGFAEDHRDGEVRDYLLDGEAQPKINSPELADAFSLCMGTLDDVRWANRLLAKLRRNRAAVKHRT